MKTAVRRLSSTWRSKVRDGNQREKNVSQTGCLPFLCVRVCGCVCSTPKDYSSVRNQQTGSALHRRGNPAPLRHLVHVSRLSQVNKRKKHNLSRPSTSRSARPSMKKKIYDSFRLSERAQSRQPFVSCRCSNSTGSWRSQSAASEGSAVRQNVTQRDGLTQVR